MQMEVSAFTDNYKILIYFSHLIWNLCSMISPYLDPLVLRVASGCSEVGQEEKQAQNELWEAEPWPALLLW